MAFKIAEASRGNVKAKIALDGPSGSGKTKTALKIARGLVGEHGRIIVIDTENNSAALYLGEDGIGRFSSGLLEGDYAPERYVEALRECVKAKADCIIVDSASHEWMGPGGCLELVDAVAKTMKGNSYMAWGEVTPRHASFLHAMLHVPCHLIATLRSKQEYAQVEENGKKKVEKLGMAPQTRDGAEYEFSMAGSLDMNHTLVFHKTRCPALDGKAFRRPGADVAEIILKWLSDGAADDATRPTPPPAPAAPKPAPPAAAAPAAPPAPTPAPPAAPTPPSDDEQTRVAALLERIRTATAEDMDATANGGSALLREVAGWPAGDARNALVAAGKRRRAELADLERFAREQQTGGAP